MANVTADVQPPLDPNEVYYDSEQGYYTTRAIEQQLAPYRAKYPNASVAPILVQVPGYEGEMVPSSTLEKIDIVQQSNQPGVFTRIQLDTSGNELGRTQFQQQGFFQSPVFGILASAVIPVLGGEIAALLGELAPNLSVSVTETVGRAMAKVTLDVAQGKDFQQAVQDTAIATLIQTGSVAAAKELRDTISDPSVRSAIVSAGASAAQAAAKGGDPQDIFRNAVAGAVGAIAATETGSRPLGGALVTGLATGSLEGALAGAAAQIGAGFPVVPGGGGAETAAEAQAPVEPAAQAPVDTTLGETPQVPVTGTGLDTPLIPETPVARGATQQVQVPTGREVVAPITPELLSLIQERAPDVLQAAGQQVTVTGAAERPITPEDVATAGAQRVDVSGRRDFVAEPVPVTGQREFVAEPVTVSGGREFAAEPVQVTGKRDFVAEPVSVTGKRDFTAEPVSVTGTREYAAEPVTVTGKREYVAEPVEVTGKREFIAEPVSVLGEKEKPLTPEIGAEPEKQEPGKPTKEQLFISGYVQPKMRMGTPSLTPAMFRSSLDQALSAYTPPGEVEDVATGKTRRDVWNEASLRLKDALGL